MQQPRSTVLHSRGNEAKAISAIIKAIDTFSIDMEILGEGLTNHDIVPEFMQNRLWEVFMAAINSWAELADIGIYDPEIHDNVDVILNAAYVRDMLKVKGQWKY